MIGKMGLFLYNSHGLNVNWVKTCPAIYSVLVIRNLMTQRILMMDFDSAHLCKRRVPTIFISQCRFQAWRCVALQSTDFHKVELCFLYGADSPTSMKLWHFRTFFICKRPLLEYTNLTYNFNFEFQFRNKWSSTVLPGIYGFRKQKWYTWSTPPNNCAAKASAMQAIPKVRTSNLLNTMDLDSENSSPEYLMYTGFT